MSFVAVPSFIVTILAYLHIISAMGWLGGAVLFVSTLAPALRTLSPASSLDFIANAVPKLTRFFLMVATSTIVFGPALLLTIPDYSQFIYVGIALGLAAYVDALLTIRAFHRLSRMAKGMMQGSQTASSPADFQKAAKGAGLMATSIVVLLLLTLMFMVYSGYPF